jgi:hypothetical protein
MRRFLAIVALACAGCAEMSPSGGPPAAPAVSPSARRTWQQFCEQSWTVPQASALAAARGADGWELVAMYNGVLCFKRPVVEAAGARPVGPGTPASPAPSYVPVLRDPGF